MASHAYLNGFCGGFLRLPAAYPRWLKTATRPLVGGSFRNANRATVVGQPISLGDPDSAGRPETGAYASQEESRAAETP